MVFHAPQSGHFPIHRGDWLPQDWQTKTVLLFDDFMMKYSIGSWQDCQRYLHCW